MPLPLLRPPARARASRVSALLFGYLAVPLLNAVSPLLALPAITSMHGASAWAAVAIGQSLGGTAGVVVELGWGLSGTQRVARQSRRNRARSFALSIVTKGMVAVPAVGAAVVVAVLLAPAFRGEAAVVAAAAGIAMFSAGWIFIGTARPRLFLLTEAVPRTACVAVAAGAIALGAPLACYAAALLIPAIAAPLAAARVLGVSRESFRGMTLHRYLLVIRAQASALTSRVLSSVYISFSVAVVSLGSSDAVLLYASLDRILRMAQQVLVAPHYVLKGWVGRAVNPAERVRRALRSVLFNVCAGTVAGIGFGVLAPVVVDVVFSRTVHVPPGAALAAGLTLAVISTSMATGTILLVALQRIQAVAWSAAAGAAIGLPLIYAGTVTLGGFGAVLGQLAAEGAVLAVQVVAAGSALRRRRRRVSGSAVAGVAGGAHPSVDAQTAERTR